VVDQRVLISSGNAGINFWPEELAKQVNDLYENLMVIGAKDQSTQEISYRASRVFDNAVWAKDAGYSSSTSIIKAGEEIPPVVVEPPTTTESTDSSSGSSGGGSFPTVLMVFILAVACRRKIG